MLQIFIMIAKLALKINAKYCAYRVYISCSAVEIFALFFLHLVCTSVKLIKFHSISKATIFNIYIHSASPQNQLAATTSSAAATGRAYRSNGHATTRPTVATVPTSPRCTAVSINQTSRLVCKLRTSPIWISYRQELPQQFHVPQPGKLRATRLGLWRRSRLRGRFGWIWL